MKVIESFSYRFLLLSVIFGIFLYDYIGLNFGFRYIDEILMISLLAFYISKGQGIKEFRIFIGVYLLYIVYSLVWGVARYEAVFIDAIIFLKSFIGFYCAYCLGMSLTQKHKKYLSCLVIVISMAVLVVSILSYEYVIYGFFGHPSRFATMFQIFGMLYLYCFQEKKKSIFIVFFLWACAMLSFRSKSYAFFSAAIFIYFFMSSQKLQRIRFSTIFSISLLAGISLFFAWEKFKFHFIVGISDNYTESFARPALYQVSLLLYRDFFPFGTGFGSYSNYASAVYYSPIYKKYLLDSVHGLSETKGSFICDTFFPQLAQFGIVGTLLFFFFFWKRYQEAIKFFYFNRDERLLKMSMLIIIFFMIESTVDSTFVHNRGMIMAVLWGMILGESKHKARLVAYQTQYKYRDKGNLIDRNVLIQSNKKSQEYLSINRNNKS